MTSQVHIILRLRVTGCMPLLPHPPEYLYGVDKESFTIKKKNVQ
jgi:hypothetical protein